MEYLWYRDIEGFARAGRNPWWKNIDWKKEEVGKRAQMSVSRLEGASTVKLPGFFWEVLRRMPETKSLLDGLSTLFPCVNDGENVAMAVEMARARGQNLFLREVGLERFEALKVVRDRWRNSYDQLDLESKAIWNARYRALWQKIGRSGSVPAGPVEYPHGSHRFMAEQWRTAFDLLKNAVPPEAGNEGYDDSPIPGMLLPLFTKLRPTGQSAAEKVSPVNAALAGKTNPNTYPWVGVGILKRRLARIQMCPVVLAVDFSKTTDSIMRDFKFIIDEKRRSLGVCVTSRRVQEESFVQIERLDAGVFNDDGSPPGSRNVVDFEKVARLDFSDILGVLAKGLGQIEQEDPQDNEKLGLAASYMLEKPIKNRKPQRGS